MAFYVWAGAKEGEGGFIGSQGDEEILLRYQ